MEEELRAIKDYEMYKVSNFGYVSRNGKILKHTYVDGYKRIVLCKSGITKSFTIHRLVAQAFIPNPNNLPQVNHIDGNKENNCVDNLEWVTASDNRKHAIRHGLITFDKLKKPVHQLYNGKIINTFESINEAHRQTNIDGREICHVLKGKIKNTFGYTWEYAKRKS